MRILDQFISYWNVLYNAILGVSNDVATPRPPRCQHSFHMFFRARPSCCTARLGGRAASMRRLRALIMLLLSSLSLCSRRKQPPGASMICDVALRDTCGSDATWASRTACAACIAANRSALAARGCAPEQLASFCDGGACHTAIRTWCGQMKSTNFSSQDCLKCAGPAAYAGVITAEGCNGSFALWKDKAQHIPSPILSAACTERQCTRIIEQCVSPQEEFHGKFEVNRTERDECSACIAARRTELEAAGCAHIDESRWCKLFLPPAPDVLSCEGALRDTCGSDAVWGSSTACSACISSNGKALQAQGCAPEQLAGFCTGGGCKTTIRKWCGQTKDANFSSQGCLECASPAAYFGVITAGGCNGSFALWKDKAQHVPSPILSEACAIRPCTMRLDHCVSPTVIWNGAASANEVNATERDACLRCVAATQGGEEELRAIGCGAADIAEYCKGGSPNCKPGSDDGHCLMPQPMHRQCPGALRDACGSQQSSATGCAACVSAHSTALQGSSGCEPAEIHAFCVAGQCKVALQLQCGQLSGLAHATGDANYSTKGCLHCATVWDDTRLAPAGCNSSANASLGNDTNPSAFLIEQCQLRSCTALLQRLVPPPVCANDGYAGGALECNATQRSACEAATATHKAALADSGCGVTDLSMWCRTEAADMPPKICPESPGGSPLPHDPPIPPPAPNSTSKRIRWYLLRRIISCLFRYSMHAIICSGIWTAATAANQQTHFRRSRYTGSSESLGCLYDTEKWSAIADGVIQCCHGPPALDNTGAVSGFSLENTSALAWLKNAGA